jgi:hypothetical protein
VIQSTAGSAESEPFALFNYVYPKTEGAASVVVLGITQRLGLSLYVPPYVDLAHTFLLRSTHIVPYPLVDVSSLSLFQATK